MYPHQSSRDSLHGQNLETEAFKHVTLNATPKTLEAQNTKTLKHPEKSQKHLMKHLFPYLFPYLSGGSAGPRGQARSVQSARGGLGAKARKGPWLALGALDIGMFGSLECCVLEPREPREFREFRV